MAHIGINLNKAKDIQKERMREVRKPLLEAEDITYMRAIEAGNTDAQTASAVRKQALRDVTQLVDDATITATDVVGITSELKAVWNTNVLGENPS
jgi:hypothetical protein|tara:strand:- start:809 stop:1093 length:285 start_codon:yes stop_codon:yes gene_type:complete